MLKKLQMSVNEPVEGVSQTARPLPAPSAVPEAATPAARPVLLLRLLAARCLPQPRLLLALGRTLLGGCPPHTLLSLRRPLFTSSPPRRPPALHLQAALPPRTWGPSLDWVSNRWQESQTQRADRWHPAPRPQHLFLQPCLSSLLESRGRRFYPGQGTQCPGPPAPPLPPS